MATKKVVKPKTFGNKELFKQFIKTETIDSKVMVILNLGCVLLSDGSTTFIPGVKVMEVYDGKGRVIERKLVPLR